MKPFLKIVGTLVLVFLLFLTVTPAFLGSPSWTVTVDRVMDAPPAKIYAELTRLESWKDWTKWEGLEFSGPPAGVGATLDWNSAGSTGQLVITEVVPDQQITYDITMEGGNARSHGTIRLRTVEAGTLVRWMDAGEFFYEGEVVEEGVVGYFFRFAGAAMRATMKKGFATHLERLEELIAKKAAEPTGSAPTGSDSTGSDSTAR